MRFLIIFIFFIFLNFCFHTRENKKGELEFETFEKGFYSGIKEKKEIVIKNKKEFLEMWKNHTKILLPLPEPPEIDFDKYMLICTFMGEKPTGGFSIEIKKIVENDREISVYVKEISPGKNCIVTMAFTQPYHIVLLKKSKKKIKFYYEEEIKDCF
ncbi:MAG: protease complex subunit PrcB family protein [candidate division WOR-3 bacterium]